MNTIYRDMILHLFGAAVFGFALGAGSAGACLSGASLLL